MTMMLTLVVLIAAVVALWVPLAPKPQPVRVRRNPLQEDLLARYLDHTQR